jgi:hypothetical protein
MRTISLRLDDASDQRLQLLCSRLGQSQTSVIKTALQQLSLQQLSPADLAEQLGLPGCFRSAAPGSSARDHSQMLKQQLRQRHRAQARASAAQP